MKVFLNLIFILLTIVFVFLGIVGIELNNAVLLMTLGIIVSLVGIILLDSLLNEENKNNKLGLYNTICVTTIILAILDICICYLFFTKVPNIYDTILLRFGLKEEVVENYDIDLYTYDDYFKLTFDTSKNTITVYKSEIDKIRSYTLSLYELPQEKQNEIKENYHGKIDINNSTVVALYGIFNYSDNEDSIATPYIELNTGVYGIEGNQLIIDNIFTLLFNRNNIFKYKVLTIMGNTNEEVNEEENNTNNEDTQKSSILIEYYTDKDYKYIYNGKRLYKDVYICENYSKYTTPEKMKEYISFLKLEDSKQVEHIIGKEIKVGGDVVNKVRLYYYNNLDSLNFIEIILTGKTDSIIIKESDPQFKFNSIQKLY